MVVLILGYALQIMGLHGWDSIFLITIVSSTKSIGPTLMHTSLYTTKGNTFNHLLYSLFLKISTDFYLGILVSQA